MARVSPEKVKEIPEFFTGDFLPEGIENGPITKRNLTDAPVLVVIIPWIIVLIICPIIVFALGNPLFLGRVYDADGNYCGHDAGYEDYPYLYFPIPQAKSATRTVCVKSCPVSPLPSVLACKTNSKFQDCIATSKDITVISAALASGNPPTGAFYVYKTTPFFNRICVPLKNGSTFEEIVDTLFIQDAFEKWVGDIKDTWPVIIFSIGLATITGIVYLLLMKKAPGFFFIAASLLFVICMTAVGVILILGIGKTEDQVALVTEHGTSSGSIISKTNTFRAVIAGLAWGISIPIYIAIMFISEKVKMVRRVIRSVTEYINDTPTIFAFLLVMILILFAFFVYMIAALLCVTSFEDLEYLKSASFGSSKLRRDQEAGLVFFFLYYFWFSGFIVAFTQCVIASSASMWYFANGTDQKGQKTVWVSVKRMLRYHLVSIAIGSFLLTSLEFLRIGLSIFQSPPKLNKPQNNRLARFTCQCFSSCVQAIGKYIMHLNKTAYIQIALTGKGFFSAASDAYTLSIQNPHRIGVLSGIGSTITFYKKLFFAALSSLIGLLMMVYWDTFSTKIYAPVLTTVIIFLFAYEVGSVLMSAYGMTVDTLVVCNVIDQHIMRVRNIPSQHCPRFLLYLMNKARKINEKSLLSS